MVLKIENNNIFLYGYIWEGDGATFVEEFAKVDATYPELEMHLHCYGGSVFDGNMIYNAVIGAFSDVNTNVIGVGASMGAVIAQAGKIRRQVSNGFQMIHAASGGTYGTYQDHLNSANLLMEVEKYFTRMLVNNTGKTAKDVKQWLVGDNWFSAEQALAEGLIHEIIDPLAILDVEIDEPETLGTQEIYNRFAASMKIQDIRPKGAILPVPVKKKTVQQKKPQNKIITTMEQSSIDLLGLTGVTPQSSETSIVQAIMASKDAYKSKYEQEKTARENLEAGINAQKESKITALLEEAVSSGKITAQQRTVYENIGKTSGVEALETVLAGLNQRTPIVSLIPGGKGAATSTTLKAGWNWDQYQKEDPRALEAMKTDNLDAFKALFKAKFGVDFSED